jgi:hypothetical protein
MAQKPFQAGAVVNLSAGESVKEIVICTVPAKKRFDVKFLGINGFGHPNRLLFYAVHVTTRSVLGIYPIAPTGIAEIDEPEFPTRFFGSQEATLYAIRSPTSSFQSRARSPRLTYGYSSASADCSLICELGQGAWSVFRSAPPLAASIT